MLSSMTPIPTPMKTPNPPPMPEAPHRETSDAEVTFFGKIPSKSQPIVTELIALLEFRPDLADALTASIGLANLPDVTDLPRYHEFPD